MLPLLLLLPISMSEAGAAAHVAAPARALLDPGQEEQERKPPTEAEVAQAVEAVRSALRARDREAAKSALEAAAGVPHRDVVRAVTAALESDDTEIVVAALQSLRFLDHPAALEALHVAAKERDRRTTPEIAVPLFRAIGQHGDPRSIEILAHNVDEVRQQAVVQSRILALGHIRSPEAVERLIELRVLTGPGGRHRVLEGWKDDFRLALMALTGVDNGVEADSWERWWRANRKTFRVPEAFPPLPEDLARRWRNYWGEGRKKARRERREDRGRGD